MKKLVIANRGEIARRILRAARSRGYRTAVVSTPSDADAVILREADTVLEVDSFLNANAIVHAAKDWGAELLHPGYGFLSENAAFAELLEQAGITFVGPTSLNMKQLGPKEAAKQFAQRCDVPTLPALWSETVHALPPNKWPSTLANAGLKLPLLVKASNGGGGRGLRIVHTWDSLAKLIESARTEAAAGFGEGRIFIEQYLENARHIEVQIFGDGAGNAISIGDRECSVQRRYQKIIEEAPAPHIPNDVRQKLSDCAVALAKEARYRGAGTVEFLLDTAHHFYFLEMNTRIQVEHSVTEMAWGVDIVQAQFDLAEGHWPSQLEQNSLTPRGHAIEVRIVAENPVLDFVPTPGTLVRYQEPTQIFVRVDSGVVEGSRINPDYDSLIAKVIASGIHREDARKRLLAALEKTVLHGCATNLAFAIAVLHHHDFVLGRVHTKWVEQNMAALNKPLLPQSVQNLLTSQSVVEELVLALCGGLACHNKPLAQKFSNLSNAYLRIGSKFEESPWTLSCLDAPTGLFALSGEAVLRALLDAAPELAEHSEAVRELHSQSRHNGQPLSLPFVATRVNPTRIAVTCLGQTFTVESHRHRAPVSGQAPRTKTEITAPLAGKITAVCVEPQQNIQTGQVLFVMESMKMQFEIRADHDAVIDTVVAAPGQVLTGPSVLATLKIPVVS